MTVCLNWFPSTVIGGSALIGFTCAPLAPLYLSHTPTHTLSVCQSVCFFLCALSWCFCCIYCKLLKKKLKLCLSLKTPPVGTFVEALLGV